MQLFQMKNLSLLKYALNLMPLLIINNKKVYYLPRYCY
jgi:hypothetical protein